jgi:hypothetical protein
MWDMALPFIRLKFMSLGMRMFTNASLLSNPEEGMISVMLISGIGSISQTFLRGFMICWIR